MLDVPEATIIDAKGMMPRWRRFWAAHLHCDAQHGDVVRQQIREKPHLALERRTA